MRNKIHHHNSQVGFTLIELLTVISIISLLSSIIISAFAEARENARYAVAISNQRQIQKAAQLYYEDMGFYPPDVHRGWDPGFSKPLPYSPERNLDCNIDISQCDCSVEPFYASCNGVPADWETQVVAKWKGPYLQWPAHTPWGGDYDYNYWTATGQSRGGCWVNTGLYVSLVANIQNQYWVPGKTEQKFLNNGLDVDNCINGEVHLILFGITS